MKLISIVTPCYNEEENIELLSTKVSELFEGPLSNYDYEHIFIDGFSSDATIDIIKKYQKKHPNKIKLAQFKPKGISNAMNHGIDESSGKYLIHLHSDDSFYDKNVLQRVDDFIVKNDEPDWLYGKAKVINVENKKIKIIPNTIICSKPRFWLLLILSNYIPHQSLFIKKNIFDKYGKFDETLKNYMDFDLWLKLTKNKVPAKFINEIICNFIIRENAQSTIGRSGDESIILCNRYVKNRIIIKILLSFNKIYKILLRKISVYKI